MNAPFTMPPVEIGQIVHWHPDHESLKSGRPVPGVVLRIAERTILVQLFDEEVAEKLYRDGVRHFDDPLRNEHSIRECGIWVHTPRTIAQDEMLKAFQSRAEKAKT